MCVSPYQVVKMDPVDMNNLWHANVILDGLDHYVIAQNVKKVATFQMVFGNIDNSNDYRIKSSWNTWSLLSAPNQMNAYALQDGQDQTVISAKPIQVVLNKGLVQDPGNVSVKTIPWVNIALFKTNPFH